MAVASGMKNVTSARTQSGNAAGPTAAATGSLASSWLGLAAVVMASINNFGGFAVTARMLAMYKSKKKG